MVFEVMTDEIRERVDRLFRAGAPAVELEDECEELALSC
jgi:hypothetical protein